MLLYNLDVVLAAANSSTDTAFIFGIQSTRNGIELQNGVIFNNTTNEVNPFVEGMKVKQVTI